MRVQNYSHFNSAVESIKVVKWNRNFKRLFFLQKTTLGKKSKLSWPAVVLKLFLFCIIKFVFKHHKKKSFYNKHASWFLVKVFIKKSWNCLKFFFIFVYVPLFFCEALLLNVFWLFVKQFWTHPPIVDL